MADCLFCRIRDGEIPAKRVHEDDRCFAIRDIDLEVYLELPGSGVGWQPSRTRNVSLGGVFVNTEARWPVGTKLHMQLRLPSGAMVEGEAIVRWPDGKGIGLQFDGLRAKDIW